MNSLNVSLILLALISFSSRADSAEITPEKTLQNWANAFVAGDLEQMLEFYEDSEKVMVVFSTGESIEGRKALRKRYRDGFNEALFHEVTLSSVKVRQHGDTAWAHGRFKADTIRKPSQGKYRIEIQTTFVLKKVNDQWKIALEHSSPIADVQRLRRRVE